MDDLWCKIAPQSPLCILPPGITDPVTILNIQIDWLQNQIDLKLVSGTLYFLYMDTIDILRAKINAFSPCIPPRPPVVCPCQPANAVYDPNGSLELITLVTKLTMVGITQVVVASPCLLYLYTPAILYSISFGVNGAQFQIKRLYKNEKVWVLVASSADLGETVKTLKLFEPFLEPSQVMQFWGGIMIPPN